MKLVESSPKLRSSNQNTATSSPVPTLCFSGWNVHLKELENRLLPILHELNAYTDYDLLLLGPTRSNASTLLPRLSNSKAIRKIHVFQFDALQNVQTLLLQRCTCGVIPSLSMQTVKQPTEEGPVKMSMKSSANAGRAFLFAQLGIPFVTDPDIETVSFISSTGADIRNFVGFTAEQWLNLILKWFVGPRYVKQDLFLVSQYAREHLTTDTEARKLMCSIRKIHSKLIVNKSICISSLDDARDKLEFTQLSRVASSLRRYSNAWIWESNHFAWRTRSILNAIGLHIRSTFSNCTVEAGSLSNFVGIAQG